MVRVLLVVCDEFRIKPTNPLAVLSYWYVDKTKKIVNSKINTLFVKISFETTMTTAICSAISCSVFIQALLVLEALL